MKRNAILLQELTVDQLQQLIGTAVKNGIQEFQIEIQFKTNSEELLKRGETCQFLNSRLCAWSELMDFFTLINNHKKNQMYNGKDI